MSALKPAPLHVDVNPAGELVFVCPLCEDTKGHMQLNVQKGLYFCLRCSQGGTVLSLRKRTGIAWPYDPEAWKYKGKDKTTAHSVLQLAFKGGPVVKAAPAPKAKIDYAGLIRKKEDEHQYYIPQAVADPAGLGSIQQLLYLNLLDEAWWTNHSLPLPADAWAFAIQATRYLATRGYTRSELKPWHLFVVTDQAAGIRSSRVVFPCWHPETKLMTDYRARTLSDFVKPKYIGPQLGPAYGGLMYGPLARYSAAMFQLNSFVLCEGPLDVIAIERTGVSAIAVLGKGVQRRQAEELRYYGGKEAIIMLDAGEEKAAVRLGASLLPFNLKVKVARLQNASDPGGADVLEIRTCITKSKELTFTDYLRLATYV